MFILLLLIISNLSGAHHLVQIPSCKRGYWLVTSKSLWMTIPHKGRQESILKWESRNFREIGWRCIHWNLFCDLVVITMYLISQWLRNITLEQAILSRNSASSTSWRNFPPLQMMMIMFSAANGTRERHEPIFILSCHLPTLNIWRLRVIFLLLTLWHSKAMWYKKCRNLPAAWQM